MIVNDTYTLELVADRPVAPGEEVGLLGRVEYAFVPEHLDLGRKHGQQKWKLVELGVGDVEVTSSGEVEDIGPVKKGAAVSAIVKNIGHSTEWAKIWLIGTLNEDP